MHEYNMRIQKIIHNKFITNTCAKYMNRLNANLMFASVCKVKLLQIQLTKEDRKKIVNTYSMQFT